MAVEDAVTPAYPELQAQIGQRLQEVLDAVPSRHLHRHELYGPKFTKLDLEPLSRQDAETTGRLERGAIEGLQAFTARVLELKVDVFEPAAVATFVYDCAGTTTDNEPFAAFARSTLEFVQDGSEWKIVHEHFSPWQASP